MRVVDNTNPPDETDPTSSSPVILLTAGLELSIPVGGRESNDSIGLEAGIAKGWSADEGIENADDTAVYVGFNFSFLPKKTGGVKESS